jgi:hypothetical protein
MLNAWELEKVAASGKKLKSFKTCSLGIIKDDMYMQKPEANKYHAIVP